jgi:hypothetical protein
VLGSEQKMNSVFTMPPCGEKKCVFVGVANWLSNREIAVKWQLEFSNQQV